MKINPELLCFMTPPDEVSLVKIPRGTRKTFLENLDEVQSDEYLPWTLRTVEKNETLASIAEETSASISDICALNSFDAPTVRLRSGQVLRIPKELRKKSRFSSFGTETSPTPSTFTEPEPGASVSEQTDSASITPRTFTPVEQYQRRSGKASSIRHIVKRGETLASVATFYGTTVRAVMKANRMRSVKALRSGQRLRIPVPRVQSALTTRRSPTLVLPDGPAPIAYTVTKTDSLSTICTRFGVSERQLRGWNPDFTDSLQAGRTLTIYPKLDNENRRSMSREADRGSDKKFYVVRKGETLSVIARRSGIPLKKLQSLNGGSDKIFVGKKIRLR